MIKGRLGLFVVHRNRDDRVCIAKSSYYFVVQTNLPSASIVLAIIRLKEKYRIPYCRFCSIVIAIFIVEKIFCSGYRQKRAFGTSVQLPQLQFSTKKRGLSLPGTFWGSIITITITIIITIIIAVEWMVVVQGQHAIGIGGIPPGRRERATRQMAVLAHEVGTGIPSVVVIVLVLVVIVAVVQVFHEFVHCGLDAPRRDRKRILGPEKDGLAHAPHCVPVGRRCRRRRRCRSSSDDLEIAPASVGPGFGLVSAMKGLDTTIVATIHTTDHGSVIVISGY